MKSLPIWSKLMILRARPTVVGLYHCIVATQGHSCIFYFFLSLWYALKEFKSNEIGVVMFISSSWVLRVAITTVYVQIDWNDHRRFNCESESVLKKIGIFWLYRYKGNRYWIGQKEWHGFTITLLWLPCVRR